MTDLTKMLWALLLSLCQLFVQMGQVVLIAGWAQFALGVQFPAAAGKGHCCGKPKPIEACQHLLADSVMGHEIAYIMVWAHLQALFCTLPI